MKKQMCITIICFILSIFIIALGWMPAAADYIGDCNKDGSVNINDVLLLLKKVTDDSVNVNGLGDINSNGIIDITDVLALLKMISSESFITATPTKAPSTVMPSEIASALNPDAVFSTTTGCTEAVIKNVKSKDYIIKSFTDEDFSVLDTDMIDGAKFETIVLAKNSHLVTMYWHENDKTMKILWESVDEKAMSVLSPNEATDKGAIQIVQIGTERVNEKDNPLIGMCYVIKLSDGSAIILDGGFNNTPCADNLYNALEKMDIAKDGYGKYIIKAWSFSHGHVDHTGIMYSFSLKYSNSVTVEYLIHNIPANNAISPLDCNVSDFDNTWKNAFPNAVRINPHAGIKYYFGNATLEMLYTPDLVATPSSPITYYNNSSIVMKVVGAGASLLSYGDAADDASLAMFNNYATSAFKCDIVQITHHGLYTGPNASNEWPNLKKIYEATQAPYAFLPMQSRYGMGNSERNGRFTVIVEWGYYGRTQMAFVVNETLLPVSQSEFNSFVDLQMSSPSGRTVLGYNGINKITNEQGMTTYLGANNYSPMVTIFEFSNSAATLTLNEDLYSWLG